jgi:hypothetical protein
MTFIVVYGIKDDGVVRSRDDSDWEREVELTIRDSLGV